MKLEQQVTSLELSKRLKELGVKQESLFYWQRFNSMGKLKWAVSNTTNGHCVSALTVAELGEILPHTVDNSRQLFRLNMFKCEGNFSDESRYSLEYNSLLKDKNGAYQMEVQRADKSEADARAKMLIYLFENKLITI